MGRKAKKYHYIYKTVNVLSGKYYIGMHSTSNLNDGYLGSGTRLRYSINKHGRDNHKVEILEFCDTRELLKQREEEIVTMNEIAKVDCMNLRVGGEGGFSSEAHRIKCSKAGSDAFKKRYYNDTKFRENFIKFKKLEMDILRKDGKITTWKDNYDWTGKKHSDETKLKMSKSKNIGKVNSQFGKCWITNEVDNKKIIKGDSLPDGWRLGRVMK